MSYNLLKIIEQPHLKKNLPDIRVGDTVRVHQKIREGNKERVQVFEGVVIKMQGGKGTSGSFTVRRVSLGVGVEKSYPWHLPTVVKVERLKSAKVRRARIFYVRDLVGRRAQRMKKEKAAEGTWEELVADESKPESESEKNTGESGGENSQPVSKEPEKTPDSPAKSADQSR